MHLYMLAIFIIISIFFRFHYQCHYIYKHCHMIKNGICGSLEVWLRSTVNRVSASVPFSSLQQSWEIWTTPLSSTEVNWTGFTPKYVLTSSQTNRAQSSSTEVPPKCRVSSNVEQSSSTDRLQNAPIDWIELVMRTLKPRQKGLSLRAFS